MSKSRAGKKTKRRRPQRPAPAPTKMRDDFADFIEAQLRDRHVDGAKAATIKALKLSLCDGRNRAMEGRPRPFCGCGAVARPDGVMECRGMPSDDWFEALLAGRVRAEAEDQRRGDAAPFR